MILKIFHAYYNDFDIFLLHKTLKITQLLQIYTKKKSKVGMFHCNAFGIVDTKKVCMITSIKISSEKVTK